MHWRDGIAHAIHNLPELAQLSEMMSELVPLCTEWRSLRHGRNPGWAKEDVVRLANSFYRTMPEPAKALIRKGWKGGAFVNISIAGNGVYAPSVHDIMQARVFIQAVVSIFPDRVPSGYLLADALLILNEFLECKLLQPKPGQTVEMLALQEAGKSKS